MIEGVHRDFPVTMQAREAFRTTEKDLVPEGLAYDAQGTYVYAFYIVAALCFAAGIPLIAAKPPKRLATIDAGETRPGENR